MQHGAADARSVDAEMTGMPKSEIGKQSIV